MPDTRVPSTLSLWTFLTVLAAVLLVGSAGSIDAAGDPTAPGKGEDGPYTTAQAERGKKTYDAVCAECHAPDLSGLEGPALKGAAFLRKWSEAGLDRLFLKLRDEMPPFVPDSLDARGKADIIAYLLQANAVPPGDHDLPPDPAVLAGIALRSHGAQAP